LELWSKATLKPLLLPGGAVLLAAGILLQGRIFAASASVVTPYYWVVFLAAFLLAWRFHSSRVLFAIVVLLLSHRALEFFSNGRLSTSGPGSIALAALGLLVPLNFALAAWAQERGLTIPSLVPWLGLLFAESVFIAIICRPSQTALPWFLDFSVAPAGWFHWTKLPQPAWIAFATALAILASRLSSHAKPIESSLLWSLAAAFLGLQAGAGQIGSAYFATGGLILVLSLVENSYVLAYHDELTSLPARRAFNDALLRLQNKYTVAVVDIDHFKNFNDTYGHDTGDQVLRMVASKLALVSGGGQAFRIGGEEFTILFSGESLADTRPHLEILRMEIEAAVFRTRAGQERRAVPHGIDRRKAVHAKRTAGKKKPAAAGELSVTVSIGAAESGTRMRDVDTVIKAADKALYRAKRGGRNRVEVASPESARLKRNIA